MKAKNKGLGPAGVKRVEVALLDFPRGADSAEIAKVTGYRRSSASKALGELAASGKACLMRNGHGHCHWFHATHKRAMLDIQAENAKRVSVRIRVRKREEERLAQFLAFEEPPVHRIVPANEATPIRPAGPSSVWGLAA